MGHNCCSKEKVKRGLWSPEEDEKLIKHISTHGHVSWSSVPKLAGLERCGKSCRLRWINYLRPDVKRGAFTPQEERTIIRIHRILGNRWAQIAKHLPGRTDNEVKNFWNSSIKKKLVAQGLDPNAHYLLSSPPLQPPQSCHTPSNIINNNINYNNSSTCQQITRNPGSVFTLVSQEMKDTCNSVETKTPSIPPPPFPPCHISPTFLPALECQSCTNLKGFLESTSSSWGSKSLDGIDEMQRARGVLEIHKAEYVSSSDTTTGTAVGSENHIDAFSFESFDLDFDSMESTTAAATLLPSPRPFGVHCDATSTVDQLSWEYSWPYI